MACRGVLFALTANEVKTLQDSKGSRARLEYLQEEIEERYFSEHGDLLAETDKAWDAIHRSLTDGGLTGGAGAFPLSHVILGGESLYDDDDYIIRLKTPDQVKSISNALAFVSKADLRRGYNAIDINSYGTSLSDEDFEYTWDWFSGLKEFYARAAAADRPVIFTVDQ